MRINLSGLLVLAALVSLALVGGVALPIMVLRIGMVLYVVATFLEVLVNMLRHHDTHVRSRLLGVLFDTLFCPWRGSFAPFVRSRRR